MMDRATVAGFLVGATILGAALIIGQVPLHILLSPEALLVVFGGTLTATLISYSPGVLKGALASFFQCFKQEQWDLHAMVDEISALANFIRQEGALAIQSILHEVQSPLLKQGLQMMMDNAPDHLIRDRLATEIEVRYRAGMDYARVFESAGGYAPTMGIIGALIGLIHVISSFHDPAKLGQGVAGAFSATLFGVALSNLFLLPIAGKLRQRARDCWFHQTLLLQGMMSLVQGEHPIIVEEKLQGFIDGLMDQGLGPNHHHVSHQNQGHAMDQPPIDLNWENAQQYDEQIDDGDTFWEEEPTAFRNSGRGRGPAMAGLYED